MLKGMVRKGDFKKLTFKTRNSPFPSTLNIKYIYNFCGKGHFSSFHAFVSGFHPPIGLLRF